MIIPKKELNIFFGAESLCLTETLGQKTLSSYSIPHNFLHVSNGIHTATDNIKLSGIIQKLIHDNGIKTTHVNLSLSSRDVILRSFFIPWMTSVEVKGVVDFEVRRYIPFRLEELSYIYQPTTIIEKRAKRIRILFIAIKRETLERYQSIAEQAGLTVIFSEPAILSLARFLTLKKHIQNKQRVAIVQVNYSEGAISIIDKKIPQFSRDFSLLGPSSGHANNDSAQLTSRLLNELRISIDYYHRQHSLDVIDKLIFIGPSAYQEFSQSLEKDLNIATMSLSAQSLLGTDDEVDIGLLNAYGVGLRHVVSASVQCNLLKTQKAQPIAEKKEPEKPLNYATTLKLATLCALSLIFISNILAHNAKPAEDKLADVAKQAGAYESIKVSEIEKKRNDAVAKLNAYRNISLKSNVAFFLSRIPRHLPKGAWLETFTVSNNGAVPKNPVSPATSTLPNANIRAASSNVSLDISGYTFHEDTNKEIDLINDFVANLKTDSELTNIFGEIKLNNVRKQVAGEYTTTAFQISCR